MTEKQRIYRQTEAEFALAKALETEGVDPERFMAAWGLTLHQFNTLAHLLYGVGDEEASLPPSLKALLRVTREASTVAMAA